MSFNNGKSLNIEELTDVEKALEDFSEGNVYLQKLLLECYSNNIKTVACCAGHKEEESFPYIAFSYSNENEQALYYLMSKLKDFGVLFTYNANSFSGSYLSLEFQYYDPKCFQIIIDAFQSFDKTKDYYIDLPKDLQNYFAIIKSINSSSLLDVDVNKSSNYFQIHYIKEGEIYNYISYSNNYDCIQLLIESGFRFDNEAQAYYIDSNLRDKNNDVLENLKLNLDKKIDEVSISNLRK